MRTDLVIEREADGKWPTLVMWTSNQYFLVGTHPVGMAVYMHQGYNRYAGGKDWIVKWADGHVSTHGDYPSLRWLRAHSYSNVPAGNWKRVKEEEL